MLFCASDPSSAWVGSSQLGLARLFFVNVPELWCGFSEGVYAYVIMEVIDIRCYTPKKEKRKKKNTHEYADLLVALLLITCFLAASFFNISSHVRGLLFFCIPFHSFIHFVNFARSLHEYSFFARALLCLP